MMRGLNQVVQVTFINARHITQHLGTSLVVVIGITGAVGMLVSFLAISEGFRHTLTSTGRNTRLIVLGSQSNTEVSSNVPREQAQLLATLPGIARDTKGRPLVSAELMVTVPLPGTGEAGPKNVPFRGVQTAAFAIRDQVRIVEGRRFERGVREVIVGRKAAQQFEGLGMGSRVAFRESDWTVVGTFESGGGVHESEIWTDAETAMSAFRRQEWQSITVVLADSSDEGLSEFNDSIYRDPRFSIGIRRGPEYHGKEASTLSKLINVLGYTVAAFMAFGATVGAFNCMCVSVARRRVEIAILRAIGFGATPVVVSVIVEALLLALLGGAAGGALAYLSCDGALFSTPNLNTFSQVTFNLRVTPDLLARGLAWALVIGAASGLLPAIRAGRLTVTSTFQLDRRGRDSRSAWATGEVSDRGGSVADDRYGHKMDEDDMRMRCLRECYVFSTRRWMTTPEFGTPPLPTPESVAEPRLPR
jgi:putative ABC transport system permease protein